MTTAQRIPPPAWAMAQDGRISTAPRLGDAVRDLRAVSLAEVEALAHLQTRVDRKYVVPEWLAARLVTDLVGMVQVLEIDGLRSFRYSSVYFDAPDLRLYLAAARGRPRRAKVRTRTYIDSGLCSLEVKTRDPRGLTVKHRRPHAVGDHRRLGGGDAFVRGFEGLAEVSAALRPTLTTRFTRSTLLLADGAARVTLDVDLEMTTPDGARARLPGGVVVETKSPGGPSDVDRLLWAGRCRPARVSKYGAGMAALHPDLPGNRWARVVRDHVVCD